jgi:hypothetical protein
MFVKCFMKVVLNGLKQFTFRGYKAWEMCESKVVIFNPNSWAYFIASKVTCEPCSYEMVIELKNVIWN